jgi:hypothetical protein
MTTDRFIARLVTRRRLTGAGLVGVAAAVAASPIAQPASAAPAAAGGTAGLDSEAGASPQAVSPDVTPTYGFQKVRIGVQIASGAYVPAGTTTVGTVLTVTETGPGDPTSANCTTQASTVTVGSSATYCVFDNGGDADTNYEVYPGDSVTVTQNSANPGLVRANQPATVGPCLPGPNGVNCATPDPDAVVTDPGIAPIAVNDSGKVVDGSKVSLNVLGNDYTAGAAPSLKVVSPPAHGAAAVVVSSAGLRIRYTPRKNYSGRDHLAYRLTTANGSATAIATVTVSAGRPKAKNDHATTKAGHKVKIHVLANDQAYGGGPLAVSKASGAKHGSVKRHKTYVVYTPRSGFTGTDTFTYQVHTHGGSDTATVTVKVHSGS